MWELVRAEVELITDALGKPVDKGIIETVTGLRAYGFPTSASCEGHFEYGCPYPWIDIEVPDSCDRPLNEKDKEDVARKRLLLEKQMIELLEEYYANRRVPYHAMLIIQEFPVNWFRLRCVGGDVSPILGWGKCNDRLKLYKAEMTAFSSYLKDRYSNG
jgi:hypothetical protein